MTRTSSPPSATKTAAVERRRCTAPRAIPMIGVDSGAMIIAPMTVAVESVRIPHAAITEDSVSMVQKADCFARWSPDG
ncbi:hypothetical protein [Streptomyces sp. NPDC090131]|uniref:hypothetical protein n=1 Tax=Streptomyces sp. NPDC090131 TaxID=3365954 RepID=UPI0038288643